MKYILSLFIALWSIAAWGQEGGDGFNPSNPGEPGQRYNLTVNVTPDGAGSTSPSVLSAQGGVSWGAVLGSLLLLMVFGACCSMLLGPNLDVLLSALS